MFDLMPWRKREGRDLVSLRGELDNLFNRFFEPDFPLAGGFMKDGPWAPQMDVIDGNKKITVKAELPGCEAEDIDVTVEGRLLRIRGDKKKESEEKKERFHHIERSYGAFSRTVELPDDVDEDSVDAVYKKGVLTLVLKKVEASDRKKIEIKTS